MPDFRIVILHILNIAVLYAILRLLVYNPVRKFMQNREAAQLAKREEAERMLSEAETTSRESQAMLDRARDESRAIINESANEAKLNAENILEAANIQAKEIIEKAHEESEHELHSMNEERIAFLSDMAIKIASEVIKREITPEDNAKLINSFFEGE